MSAKLMFIWTLLTLGGVGLAGAAGYYAFSKRDIQTALGLVKWLVLVFIVMLALSFFGGKTEDTNNASAAEPQTMKMVQNSNVFTLRGNQKTAFVFKRHNTSKDMGFSISPCRNNTGISYTLKYHYKELQHGERYRMHTVPVNASKTAEISLSYWQSVPPNFRKKRQAAYLTLEKEPGGCLQIEFDESVELYSEEVI